MRRPRITQAKEGDRPLAAAEQAGQIIPDRQPVIDDEIVLTCPRCQQSTAISSGVCLHCGFPFICDLETVEPGEYSRRQTEVWRIILGLAAMIFLLTSGAFFDMGVDEFNGRTLNLVNSVAPDHDSGIEIEGPENFVWRTKLSLGLLKLRAPDFYWRIQDNVTGIDYLGPNYLEDSDGRRISLEGIGALAHSSTGQVSVLYTTAFPSGPAEIFDRDLYSYAGVLVHELRHIELHKSGLGPGGMKEEVLCEEAAYAAMRQMEAPGGLLMRYETYLDNPAAGRYQHWYDWYKQWD